MCTTDAGLSISLESSGNFRTNAAIEMNTLAYDANIEYFFWELQFLWRNHKILCISLNSYSCYCQKHGK